MKYSVKTHTSSHARATSVKSQQQQSVSEGLTRQVNDQT